MRQACGRGQSQHQCTIKDYSKGPSPVVQFMQCAFPFASSEHKRAMVCVCIRVLAAFTRDQHVHRFSSKVLISGLHCMHDNPMLSASRHSCANCAASLQARLSIVDSKFLPNELYHVSGNFAVGGPSGTAMRPVALPSAEVTGQRAWLPASESVVPCICLHDNVKSMKPRSAPWQSPRLHQQHAEALIGQRCATQYIVHNIHTRVCHI